MTAKQDRRARKKSHRLKCDYCGKQAPKGEDHDSNWSKGGYDDVTGFVFIAWCQYCGHDYAS